MKKIILFLMIAISGRFVYAQPTEIVVGKNLSNSSDIRGRVYEFPDVIQTMRFDSASNTAFLILRSLTKNKKYYKPNGSFLVYDLTSARAKWQKDINFNTQGVSRTGGAVFLTTTNNSTYLHPETGAQVWTEPNDFYYVDESRNIGLGYKYKFIKGDFSNTLEAIELSTGKTIWTRDIKRDFGWSGTRMLDDSVLLIAANGLHAVNLKTGQGWDYNAVTGRNDYKAVVGSTLLGIATAALTGYAYVKDRPDVVGGLISNIVKDSSVISFASREKLAVIDTTGAVVWERELPRDQTAKTNLIDLKEDWLLLNLGYAYFNNRVIDYGTPYLALISKKDGTQKYTVNIGEKKDAVNGWDINDERSEITLLFDNRIAVHSLADGKQIIQRNFDNKAYGAPSLFVERNMYIANTDGSIQNINDHYAGKKVILTSKGKIAVINDALEITDTLSAKELPKGEYDYKDYHLIRTGDKTIVYDKDLKPLAELNITSDAGYRDRKVYDIKENQLIIADLTELLK